MWSLAMTTTHRYEQWDIWLIEKLLLQGFASSGDFF